MKADLARQMEEAAEQLDFEQAAALPRPHPGDEFRDPDARASIRRRVDEADVFGLAQEGGQTCIQVFFFRSGQNWGNRAYYPRPTDRLEPPEILASFLAQFYDDKPVPGLMLLSHEIEERDLAGGGAVDPCRPRIEIAVPQRGEKKLLVDHAVTNAREALGRKMAESSSQTETAGRRARVFGCRRCRSASRSMTTPIFRAPTRWAA